MPLHIQLTPARNDIQNEIAGWLFIESQLGDVNMSLKRRLIECACQMSRHVGQSIDANALTVQLRKAGQIQIAHIEIRPEGVVHRADSGATRYRSAGKAALDIVELQFVL